VITGERKLPDMLLRMSATLRLPKAKKKIARR